MPEPEATEPALSVGDIQTDLAPQTEQAVVESATPSLFTVKVGGEEMQVSMEEALAGYQRQADYTQKTQALAQERQQLSQAQQLWDAIEGNPEETIGRIADAYGFKLTAAQAAAAEASRGSGEPNPFEDGNDNADPFRAEVQQFMQQQQQREVQATIDAELASVHSKYGVQFDDTQLIQFAVDRGIANLDDAFKAWSFDAASKVAQDRKVQQQKADAPPIAGGHGTAAGAVVAGSGSKLPSIEEALEAAEAAQLG